MDSIVSFASLDRAQIASVAALSVQRIAGRAGIEGRGAELLVSPAALEALSAEGFSADYGARGLRRYLEQALVAPLASLLSAPRPASDRRAPDGKDLGRARAGRGVACATHRLPALASPTPNARQSPVLGRALGQARAHGERFWSITRQ
ncbi:MAG: hypothetical protein WDO74_29055 [Pseudomonadota bacterium]